MSQFLDIVNVVLPVFIVIGLGYGLRRVGFMTDAVTDGLSRFTFWVATPALLFRGVVHTDLKKPIDPETLGGLILDSPLLTFALKVVGVAFTVSLIVAFGIFFLGRRLGPARVGVAAQGAYRSNLVFVGFPILVNAYGHDIIGPAAVFFSFTTPLYNLIAVVVLTLPHASAEDGPSMKNTLRDVAKNPLFLACVVGLVVSGLGGKPPKVLDVPLELVGQIAMPLALVTIGASIELERLRSGMALPLLVAAIKLLIYPALIFLGLYALGVNGIAVRIAVILLATPTSVASHIMAREMKGDQQLSAQVVVTTTLLSLFTLSAWIAFFKLLDGPS